MFLLSIFLILNFVSRSEAQCDSGSYFDTQTQACSFCEIGKYQPNAGESLCIDCPDGRTTIGHGSTQASDCKEKCTVGQFLNTASSECQDCGIGTYTDSITTGIGAPVTECTRCPDERPITPDIAQDSIDDCREQCPDGEQVSVQGTAVSCTRCPKGEFRSGAIRLCVSCVAGRTTLEEGSTTPDDCVEECPAGTFRNSDSTCEACPAGRYSDTPESSDCTPCPAGTTSRQEGASAQGDCVDLPECEPGFFIDGLTCSLCPAGQYQQHREAQSCNSCPSGFTSPRGSRSESDCFRICSEGEYLSEGECLKCPKGQYQPQTGQDSCNSCGSTETTRRVGATSISECVDVCRPGTFVSNDDCNACPVGTYSSTADAAECISCRDGYTTRNTNSITLSECIPDCGPGTYMNGDVCSPCPRNTYQSQPLASGCVRCDTGRITTSEGADSINDCITACYNGTFYNQPTDSCIDCPPGSYQDENFQSRCKDCSSGFSTYPDVNGRYAANSITRCLSTNECQIGRANCHVNADCIDQDPGYTCRCQPGYEGDGMETCTHKCILEPDYCMHGVCSPVTGGMDRVCHCHAGFTGEQCQLAMDDEESDTNKILAAVLGTIGALFLLAILAVLLYVLCYRKSARTTVVEQAPPTYTAPVQHKVIERIIKPQVVRQPKEVERYIVHDVPVVEKVYEKTPVPVQTMYATAPPVHTVIAEPPPMYSANIQETAQVADMIVPDVPQTIQTEHGMATLVSAGQPRIVSSLPQF